MSSAVAVAPSDTRLVALMRLVLAGAGAAIVSLDPSPPAFPSIVHVVLFAYAAFAAWVWIVACTRRRSNIQFHDYEHWIDVAWYAVLVGLTGGHSSMFFSGFFFAVLIAAFRHGYRSAANVTCVCTAVFAVVGMVVAGWPLHEPSRLILRSVSLLALGYMIARWGDLHILTRRHLTLLSEINPLSNPRFGTDRPIGMALEQVRAFYDATACTLILTAATGGGYVVRRATRNDPESATYPWPLDSDEAAMLLHTDAGVGIIVNSTRALLPRWRSCDGVDVETGKTVAVDPETIACVSKMLGTRRWVSVPVHDVDEADGRIYVIDPRVPGNTHDIVLIGQVFKQLAFALENGRLVNHLIGSAAEEQHRRLARDVHDALIQPLVAIQLGLAGILGTPGETTSSESRPRLAQMAQLVEAATSELRDYVKRLREPACGPFALGSEVHRLAARFSAVTGISVEVDADQDLRVGDRVAREALYILFEALSNARRHADTSAASISIGRNDHELILQAENDVPEDRDISFMPRSIAERATALGGSVRVSHSERRTIVSVAIPL